MSRFALEGKETSYRFILLGKTGSGKSATGNWILGSKAFYSEESVNSVTKDISVCESAVLHGKKILVVDTPGLFDTKNTVIQTALTIQDSLRFASPGPHGFLIILKPGRFTEEEERTLEILMIMFGPKFIDHAIIIFTHLDQVKNFNKFLHESEENERIKSLFNKCGRRIFAINNEEKDREMIKQERERLLAKVGELSDNGRQYYQDDISIYRVSLEKHAEEWTDTRWDVSKIQQILREQREEVMRLERKRQEQNERKEKIEGLERNMKKETERLETALNKANEIKNRMRKEQMEELNKVLQKESERIGEKLQKVNQSRKRVTEHNIQKLEERRKDEIEKLTMIETLCERILKERTEKIKAIKTKMKSETKTLVSQWKDADETQEIERINKIKEVGEKRRKEIEVLDKECKSVNSEEETERGECFEKLKSQWNIDIDGLRQIQRTMAEDQGKNWTDKIERLETDCRNDSKRVEEYCKTQTEGNDRKLKEEVRKLKDLWKSESDTTETEWETADSTEKQHNVDTLEKLLGEWTRKVRILNISWKAENKLKREEERKEKELKAENDKRNREEAEKQRLKNMVATALIAGACAVGSPAAGLGAAALLMGVPRSKEEENKDKKQSEKQD